MAGAAVPLQNRVTPFGDIIAHPARGLLMGNRGGRLHTPAKELSSRRSASRRWIACVLDFKGRRREVMGPGYTELFFLDEATALAAGHRPCRECRRADFERFLEAWARAKGIDRPRSIDPVDQVLHAERFGPRGVKVTYPALTGDLPPGTFVAFDANPGEAFLLWHGALYPWTPAGYLDPLPLEAASPATVLTPRSIVAALGAGYVPMVALTSGERI